MKTPKYNNKNSFILELVYTLPHVIICSLMIYAIVIVYSAQDQSYLNAIRNAETRDFIIAAILFFLVILSFFHREDFKRAKRTKSITTFKPSKGVLFGTISFSTFLAILLAGALTVLDYKLDNVLYFILIPAFGITWLMHHIVKKIKLSSYYAPLNIITMIVSIALFYNLFNFINMRYAASSVEITNARVVRKGDNTFQSISRIFSKRRARYRNHYYVLLKVGQDDYFQLSNKKLYNMLEEGEVIQVEIKKGLYKDMLLRFSMNTSKI